MEARWSLCQILVDTLLLLTVGIPTPIIKSADTIFRRGFFCDDEDIMHPDTGPSTIDNKYFHPLGCLINIIVIILIEHLRDRKCEEHISLWKLRIPKWCYTSYIILVSFAFGLLSTILVTTVIKGSVGRLRPYFLTQCLPNINCSLPENQHVYHINYHCTNKKFKLNTLLSFPSGHSSFAMFCAFFLIIFIQKRMIYTTSNLPKAGLQFFLMMAALYVGISRVSDYKHHWHDVLAGFLIGGACAVLVSLNLYYVSDSLEKKAKNSEPDAIVE